MVKAIIDGISISVPENTTIVDAAASAGINIPTLCHLKEINEIGACRVCVVEIEGMDRVVSACNHYIENNMVIRTNSARVRSIRKTNLQLILSQHNSNCPICIRNGNCSLQDAAKEMGFLSIPYKLETESFQWNKQFPIIRDASKCIKCMRCVNVCEKIQSLDVWNVINTGYKTTVDVKSHRRIRKSNCAICGQCVIHCPVGALTVRKDGNKVFKALNDPNITTVVQVAPAVRAAFSESLGLPRDALTTGQLVAALKKLGFDYVFDTNFAADLTIMEEGSELLEKLANRQKYQWPMFTSCCPGWVRFIKTEYPEYTSYLSSAKSPQQMFGAVAKTYFAQKIGIAPENLCVISIMLCSAKKYECEVNGMSVTGTSNDVDIVMITREIMRFIQIDHINVLDLPEAEFDSPLGLSSGAGAIFGASGGVMEAALRSAYYLLTKKNIKPDAFKEVRGFTDRRVIELDIEGILIRCAIVSSLSKARALMEDINSGREHYDFVEVMACPGGCAGGGGQPIKDGTFYTADRMKKLYEIDHKSKIRYAHENSEVQQLYKEFLGNPLSHKAHELLHTDHIQWKLDYLINYRLKIMSPACG